MTDSDFLRERAVEATAGPWTDAQRRMLLASEPDDVTGDEGCGVELLTGADYAVAKSLVARGLGYRNGPGGSLPGMYWSNADGLNARRLALEHLRENVA